MIIDSNSDSSVDLVDFLRRSSDESENLAQKNMLDSAIMSDVYKLTGEKNVLDILYDEDTGRLTIIYNDGSTVSIYLPTNGGGCDCDLTEYVKISDLEAEISELESKIPTSTSNLTNDSDFINQTQVDERIKGIVGSAPEALDTLQEISKALGDDADFAATITNQITEVKSLIPSIDGLASTQYVDDKVAAIDFTPYATKDEVEATKSDIEKWVNEQGYLTEHQDISHLASTKYVDDAIAGIKMPSIEGLATETYVNDKFNSIVIPEVDLTPYAKLEDVSESISESENSVKSWVSEQGYITEHQDISGLATKDEVKEVENKIPSIEGLATEIYVNEAIAGIEHPSVDLTGYAKESWVEEKIAEAELNDPNIDVSTLATKSELSAVEAKIPSIEGLLKSSEAAETYQPKGDYALKSDVPSIEGLASETYVNEKFNSIVIPEVDLTEYAKKTDIPSIEGLASTQYVDDKISEINIPDVSGLATKDEVSAVQAQIPSLDGYATQKWVEETIAGMESGDVDHSVYALKTDLVGLATETYVNEKIESIEPVDLSGLATKDEVKEVENKIPSIEGLASETYVKEQIEAIEHPIVDLTGYATEEWVEGKGYLTEHQDISDVVKFNETSDGRKAITLANHDLILGRGTTGDTHVLTMLSKWDVAEFGSQEVHSNLNTVSTTEIATDAEGNNPYVDGLTIYDNEGNVSKHVPVVTVNDKFALATVNHLMAIREADSKTNAETYALKSEVPSIEGLASEQYVNEKIEAIEHPSVDLTGYAKEEWVEDKLTILETQIPDTDTLATKEEVEAKVDKSSMATINGKSLINGGDITLDLTLYKVVESLPSTNIDVNKIYLILSSASGVSDIYSEYIYVNEEWEKVGEYKATVDMTPYLKVEDAKTTYASKNEVDSKIAGVLATLQWKDSVTTFDDIAKVYPNPQEGDTVYVDDENTTYTFMDGEWVAVSANSIPQATEEYDGLMPASAMTEVKKITGIQGDVMSIEAKLSILENKISALSKTNIEIVAVENTGVVTNLNDITKDFSIQGNVTSNLTVGSSKSVTISDTEISNDAKLSLKSTGEVELKGITTSGEFTKTGSNCIVNISEADSVVIKDMTILSSQYNGIEIGMGSVMPKSVIIDNCDFSGEFSNNAISIHGTQDDAIVNISNCKFSSVSNPLRISNKSGSKLTINITNCSCDKWEEGKYAGFLLCQDFTSTSVEECTEKNLFGSDKVTINFINFTMPGGVKLTKPENMASICGTADNSQIAYVYRNAEAKADKENYVITAYSDGSAYPKINII